MSQDLPAKTGKLPFGQQLVWGVLVFGAFITAGAITQILQDCWRTIPDATILAAKPSKGGQDLKTTRGDAFFPSQVLFQDWRHPITLKVGDEVRKDPWSFVYYINGKAVTDAAWARQQYVFAAQNIIALVLLILFWTPCVHHAVKYRLPWPRTAPRTGSPDTPVSARKPRFVRNAIVIPLLMWLAAIIGGLAFFGCFTGCIMGIAKMFFDN
jgi:hypothetical protein